MEYRWVDRHESWIYVDVQGTVLGRVDKINTGRAILPKYWWQTATMTNCEIDLRLAKKSVEYVLHQ